MSRKDKQSQLDRYSILTAQRDRLIRKMEAGQYHAADEHELDRILPIISSLEKELAKEKKVEDKSPDKSESGREVKLSERSPKPKRPILISMFNAKGGVGKTTATLNIGYMLSRKFGLRVLLVDADAQCNLTGMVLNERELDEFYEKHEESDEKSEGEEEKLITMFDCFRPLIRDEEKVPISRAKKVTLSKVKGDEYPNLFYIPGHVSLSDIDDPMSLGMNNIHGHGTYPALVTNFFRAVAMDKNIDIVLFDLSPSTVGLNPTVVMGSDYWFAPFFPDSLSKQAIKNLQRKLPKWKQADAFARLRSKPEDNSWHMKANPLFLGAFPQKVKYRMKKGVSTVEESYAVWIAKINTEVEKLRNILSKEKMVSENFKKVSVTSGYGIRDFVSLGADVQHAARPICDLEYPFTHYKPTVYTDDIYEIDMVPISDNSIKVQKQVFLGYERLICVLFQNMTNEDIDMLGPDFRKKIFKYRSSQESEVDLELSQESEVDLELFTIDKVIAEIGEPIEVYDHKEDGEVKKFTQYNTSGAGGDCGFRVLGISRQDGAEKLRSFQADPQFRDNLLYKELIGAVRRFNNRDGADPTLLMDEKISQNIKDWDREHLPIQNRVEEQCNEVRRQLNELEIKLPDGTSEENILFNLRNGNLPQIDRGLTERILSDDKQSILLRHRLRDDKEILKEYIDAYALPNGLFLGTQSLYYIARKMGIGFTLFAPRSPSYRIITDVEHSQEAKNKVIRGDEVLILREAKSSYKIGFVRDEKYTQITLDDKSQGSTHRELIGLLDRQVDFLNRKNQKTIQDLNIKERILKLIQEAGGKRELRRLYPPLLPDSPEKGVVNAIIIGAHYSFLVPGEINIPTKRLIDDLDSQSSVRLVPQTRKRKTLEKEGEKEENLRRSTRQASADASARLSGIFSQTSSLGNRRHPSGSQKQSELGVNFRS